jgi:predicted peptidase
MYPTRYPCLIVFPQTDSQTDYWSRDQAQVLAALAQTVRYYHGDTQRLYLTGYSLGGAGAWYLAATHPGLFAALVPISPRVAVRPDRVRHNPAMVQLATSHDPYAAVAACVSVMPIWVFHGQDDPIVPVSESRRMSAALAARHAPVRLTIYPGVGHDAWDLAYADPALPRWLFSQHLPAR